MRPVEERDDGIQMARLDPRQSRWKYRLERLMLTPLFRATLRVGLPFALTVGAATWWFSVEDNRDAFNQMVADIRAQVESRPEFQIRMMAIDGASVLVAEEVRAVLALDFPRSSFDTDLEALHKTVVALDAVKSADLRIRQGGVLQVDVTERVPALLWRHSAGLDLLDAGGVRVGPAASRGVWPDLPVIAGDILRPDLAEALHMPAAAREEDHVALADQAQDILSGVTEEALRLHAVAGPIAGRMRGLERMGARRWDVVLDRGQRILLPETGAVQALERTIAMQQAVQMLDRDLVAVDLRLPQRPTLRMTDAATEALLDFKAIETGGEQQQ